MLASCRRSPWPRPPAQPRPRCCHRTLIVPKSTPPRYVTAEQAAQTIKSNDNIYMHSAAQYPRILAQALAHRGQSTDAAGLRNVSLYHLHVEGEDPLEVAGVSPQPFKTNNFFVGKSSRAAVAEGRSTYIPCFLSDIPRLIRAGKPKFNVAFLNVSPPDGHGFCSLGTEVCAAMPAAETADVIVAQLNPNVPRMHGNSFIHINAFDYIVPVEKSDPGATIPQSITPPASEADLKIGQLISDLVPDGACLQMGIGAIPNAVLAALKDHKHLGVHTEMFSDGVIDLIESGAIDNSRKGFLAGRSLTSFLVGSNRLYDFVNNNPGIHIDEATVTNSPVTIARNNNVVAINSAIEIDLTGQVCADSIGTRMVSGVGGQLDFVRGAALSKGGFPIICINSLSAKKNISTIVPTLKPGAGVTTSRYHVHWIVTEYGAVNLWGLDLAERARKLISIAHPSARADLARAAHERFKVSFEFQSDRPDVSRS